MFIIYVLSGVINTNSIINSSSAASISVRMSQLMRKHVSKKESLADI